MNISRARIFTRIKNKQIPDAQEAELIKRTFLDECKYPIGAIPAFMLDQYTIMYPNDTIQQHYTFCRQFAATMLNDYTSDEIEICAVYMLQLIYRYVYSPPTELADYLDTYLTTHSNKPEIEFCLNQMRYRKLKMLIHDTSALYSEEIESLILALEPIQEAYNNFDLESLKET